MPDSANKIETHKSVFLYKYGVFFFFDFIVGAQAGETLMAFE